jgi:hypothetical protein
MQDGQLRARSSSVDIDLDRQYDRSLPTATSRARRDSNRQLADPINGQSAAPAPSPLTAQRTGASRLRQERAVGAWLGGGGPGGPRRHGV